MVGRSCFRSASLEIHPTAPGEDHPTVRLDDRSDALIFQGTDGARVTIEVFDVLGVQVIAGATQDVFNVGHLAPGTCTVRLLSRDEQRVKRIVKAL